MDATADDTVATSANRDFAAHSGQAVRRMTSQLSAKGLNKDVDDDAANEAESDEEEMYEFDVYEREGYDKIMRTVAYGNDDDDEFARQICDVLEVFESLCAGRYDLSDCQSVLCQCVVLILTRGTHTVSENASATWCVVRKR